MPSLYEGFGLPPLEAMAAGVPVVVARAASLPEVCGGAALYFDPMQIDDIAEKLLTVASDRRLCADMVEAGLVQSRSYTWNSCSRKTADALRTSLKHN
jgi:glycosyltransferase involved in cell wall biosynthesis